MSQHRRERSRSFLLSVAGATIVVQLLTIVSGPLLARMLGPAGRGEVALVLAIVVLGALPAAGGLPTALSRTVGEARAPARDVVRGVFPRWAAWSVVPALAAGGVAWAMLHDSADVVGLVAVSVAVTWVWSWQFVLAGMLRGEGDLRKVNGQRIVGVALYVACVAVAFVLWPDVRAVHVIALFGACGVATLALSWLMLRRPTGDVSVRADPRALRAEGRHTFGGTIGGVDSLGIDLLLIGALLGPEPLGLYAVARTVTTFPVLVLDPLAANLLPRLAEARGEARRALERHWLRIVVIVALVMFCFLQLVIWPVLRYVFGADFAPATTCARLLILGLTLTGLRRVLQAVLQARGQGAAGSRVEAVSSLAMLGAMAAGAHFGGLNLATAGLPVVSGLSLLWLLTHLRRRPAYDEGSVAATGDDVEHAAGHQLPLVEPVERPAGGAAGVIRNPE